MRWIGACLVTAGCAGLGAQMARQWRLRLRWLEQLRQMIYFLKGEILYGHSALGDALKRVGERCRKTEGERGLQTLPLFFLSVSGRIDRQQGEAFTDIWKEELEKLPDSPLRDEDMAELKNLGDHLGYLDVQMQERTILLYLEQLDGQIAYLRMHLKERTKLYTSLGVMGGLFLTVAFL
ncbi:MAG: stage III sporulation protein AB [Lachnospiraceae bacterium]|nr:stage III sporulation protein AB [Lachnospiraceae bacterium]